jgi:hypothetical protein
VKTLENKRGMFTGGNLAPTENTIKKISANFKK